MIEATSAFVAGVLRGISVMLILTVLVYLVVEVSKHIANAVRYIVQKMRQDQEPPSPLPSLRFLYDFTMCADLPELKNTIRIINDCGYSLVCVTQDADTYTVFFRRVLSG